MNDFAHNALAAFWNAAVEDKDIPMPGIPDISFVQNGRVVTFSGPDFELSGDLANLTGLLEKVWWALGYSVLQPASASCGYYSLYDDDCNTLGSDVARLCEALDQKDACEILCTVQDPEADIEHAEVKDAAALLKKTDKAIAEQTCPDESDLFVKKLFGGRKQASELVLLQSLAEMIRDPRPLQRRECLREAAELLYGSVYVDIHRLLPVVAELVESAKNDAACVQDFTLHVASAIAKIFDYCRAFEEAMPFLDYCVGQGPRFALQHARRWRARLALGLDGAEDDWKVFSGCVCRTADLCKDKKKQEILLHLKLYRINGLFRAAESALYRRDGWPAEEPKRRKTKKPQPVSAGQRELFDRIRMKAAEEGLQLMNETQGKDMGFIGSSFGSDYNMFDKSETPRHVYRQLEKMSAEQCAPLYPEEEKTKPAAPAEGIPGEFDYDWIADRQHKALIPAAVEQWGTPWNEVPHDHASAKGSPLAELLVAKSTEYIRFRSESLAGRMKEFAFLEQYEQRQELSKKFQDKFREIIEIPETSRWDNWLRMFNYTDLQDLFFGYQADDAFRDQAVIGQWLKHLLDANEGSEDVLLETLPAVVFETIADRFETDNPSYDPEHYLAWSVTEQGKSSELAWAAMKLYQPVFDDGWKLTAVPPAEFAKTADALSIPEANEAFAQALIEFIKKYALDYIEELMPEKWLWPLAWLWHPSMEDELRDYLAEKWDGKKIKKAKRERRFAFFEWLLTRVDAPKLKAEYEALTQKFEKRKKK